MTTTLREADPDQAGDAAGLATRDLSVAYGGNLAVSKVSLSAPLGRVTGLIGPNGAGKTTTFNACNGLLDPSGGSVWLFGTDVTRRSAASRARLGLGRTFQRVEMVNAMTVAINVALGVEARLIGRNPLRQVLSSPTQGRMIETATADALAACGIAGIADRRVATLSTGQRRLVELARVLAGGFRVLLLDEPSSGLDEGETDRFASVLTRIVAERGVGILLVEHDMPLVMTVCDYLHVLDFGNLIFEGTPAQAQASDIVRAVVLGAGNSGHARVRLALEHIGAGYGDTTALRDVSLTVPSGRAVALLGPNGAGKTTLLRVASGLIKPRSGHVLLDRRPVTGQAPDALVRAGICHITEGRNVFPGLDVKDNLRMFAPPTGEAAAIERAISAFPKLGQRLTQIAGTMSGGEQQMLALARAYAYQAPIVLLDEVSMGLAPLVVDEIFVFLARLKAEGVSLLVVEQYAAKALELADIVYLLVRGRIVYAGEPEEVGGTDIFSRYLGAEVAS